MFALRTGPLGCDLIGAGAALALALATSTAKAQGPAFDCSGPVSSTERAICADPGLSQDDRSLSDAYTRALAADPSGQTSLRSQQRGFLAKRNACKADRTCLKAAYRDRLAALNGGAASPLPVTDIGAVPFQFDNPIGGYQISGLWFPLASDYGDPSGPALFRLRNRTSGQVIEVADNAVSLLDSSFAAMTDAGEVKLPTSKDLLHLPYSDKDRAITGPCPDNQDTCLSLGEIPIDLQDLDFDGTPEVVIAHKGAGQRGSPTYSVYWLAADADPTAQGVVGIDPSFYRSAAVFAKIDGLTAFDLTQRRILVMASGGACNSSVETYSADRDLPFALTGFLSYQMQGEDCRVTNYRVDAAEDGRLIYTPIPAPAH